jgi:TonB-linked SusC/RagA family outer membrane protein
MAITTFNYNLVCYFTFHSLFKLRMKQFSLRMSLLVSAFMLLAFAASAQFRITGNVKDATTGDPLIGATIVVKGAAGGARTDTDGNFTLEAPGRSATLIVSYTGYQSFEKVVDASSPSVVISLTEGDSRLEEVVVTGLASNIKRSNVGTSVSRLNGDDLVGSSRAQTLDGAISGKLVGAFVQQNSGAPGGGISMKLRGISSVVGSSEPLYVIDGIIIDNSQFGTGAGTRAFNGAVTTANAGSQDQASNRIADINPADVESIDILKGPAAAAVYGTRANAGVVVITTKRGKAGRTQVKLSQDVGMAQAINLLPSEDWTEAKIRQYGGAYGIGVNDALTIFRAANGQTVDYDKEFFGETGRILNTNLSLSGGNEKTKFYVAGGLNDETGIMKTTGFKRYSARVNVDHRLNKWIDFKVNSAYYNTYSSRSFLGNDNNGVSIGYSIAYIPNFLDLRPREVNGVLVYPESPGTGQNPYEVRDRMQNLENINRFLNSSEVNFALIQKENSLLKLSVRAGVDYLLQTPRIYAPEDIQYQLIRPNPGASRYANNQSTLTYLQTFLTYNYKIAGKLDMTSQVGVLRNDRKIVEDWIQGEGLLPGQRNPSTAAVRIPYSFRTEIQEVAADFSQDINWDDKVILRGGLRIDRSSLFGDVNKWYAFPRMSAAVNLHNFSFLEGNSFITQIKPRFAFGRSGGAPQYGDRFSTMTATLIDGKLGLAAPTIVGNSGLEPETAQEIEVGADIGLLKGLVTIEATYYDKRILDFLFPYTLSTSAGVSSIGRFPVGDMSNKGLELALILNPVKKANFNWTTTFQFWNNRTKIERLIVPPAFVPTSGFGNFGRMRLQEGLSPSLWWGRDGQARTPVVFDKDGNSFTAAEAVGKKGLRDGQPLFQLSWVNNITFFKNFDFSMFWHTSQGNYLSTLTRELKDEGGTTSDWSQPSGQKAADGSELPKGLSSRLFGNVGYSTTDFVFDASYIRLREVSLYYNIPGMSAKTKGNISRIRVGVSAQNPITISDILDITYDPEASNFGNRALGFGVDLTPFPSSKRFFFHVQAEF